MNIISDSPMSYKGTHLTSEGFAVCSGTCWCLAYFALTGIAHFAYIFFRSLSKHVALNLNRKLQSKARPCVRGCTVTVDGCARISDQHHSALRCHLVANGRIFRMESVTAEWDDWILFAPPSASVAGTAATRRHSNWISIRSHYLPATSQPDLYFPRHRENCTVYTELNICSATSAWKSSIRRFVITEKAPTRAFSLLKAPTTTFTFKTLLRHYAKQAVTPR